MDQYEGRREMKDNEIRPEQIRSARARAAARRKKRQIRRRIILSSMAAVVVLLVGGSFFGISHYRITKAKKEFITQASEAIGKQDYAAAIALVDQVVEKADGKVGKLEKDALLFRAEAEYRLEDYDAAIQTYDLVEQAAKKEKEKEIILPLKANVYNQKAVASIEDGNSDEALAAIEQGLALAGEDTQLIKNFEFNRAVAYEYKQDFDTALTLFKEYENKYGADELIDREIAFLESRVSGQPQS